MGEEILNRAEPELVTADDISSQLASFQGSIEASVLSFHEKPGYKPDEAERIISSLRDRIRILSEGLLPADDYSGLYSEIDTWLGMADALSYKPEAIQRSEELLERSLDAVQGNMIVNGLLSDEAKKELGISSGPDEVESD